MAGLDPRDPYFNDEEEYELEEGEIATADAGRVTERDSTPTVDTDTDLESTDTEERVTRDRDTEPQVRTEVALTLFPFRDLSAPPPLPSFRTYRHPNGPLWKRTPRKRVHRLRNTNLTTLTPSIPSQDTPNHTTRDTFLRKRVRPTADIGPSSWSPASPDPPAPVSPQQESDFTRILSQMRELERTVDAYDEEIDLLKYQVHQLQDCAAEGWSLVRTQNRALRDAHIAAEESHRLLREAREELRQVRTARRAVTTEIWEVREESRAAQSTIQTMLSIARSMEASLHQAQADAQAARSETHATRAAYETLLAAVQTSEATTQANQLEIQRLRGEVQIARTASQTAEEQSGGTLRLVAELADQWARDCGLTRSLDIVP